MMTLMIVRSMAFVSSCLFGVDSHCSRWVCQKRSVLGPVSWGRLRELLSLRGTAQSLDNGASAMNVMSDDWMMAQVMHCIVCAMRLSRLMRRRLVGSGWQRVGLIQGDAIHHATVEWDAT